MPCLLSLLLTLAGLDVHAQQALSYVPFNADLVLTVDFERLDKKVNIAELKQYDFYQALIKESANSASEKELIAHLTYHQGDLAELGYDMTEPFVFFMEKEGNQTILCLVAKMGNRSTYEASLKNLLLEQYTPNLSQVGGAQLWQDEKDTYAWNDEVIVNTWTMPTPGAYNADWGMVNQYPPSYEEGNITLEEEATDLEEIMVDPDSFLVMPDQPSDEGLGLVPPPPPVGDYWMETQKDSTASRWAIKVLQKDFLLPINRNERFMLAADRGSDLHFWMDYSLFTESLNQNQNLHQLGSPQFTQIMTSLYGFMGVFYSDTYLSMGLNFENGQLALRSELFFNDDMKQFYQKALDVKFNKKFLRYIKGGNELFGYFYVNYNIENTIEEGKALLYKLFDATPQYGEAAADAMKILGIFIDEQAIGNLLKGDLMVSVSGLQEVEIKTQTYEYDEDFNYTAKDTVMIQTVPVFTALASYGSSKDIQKFIDLGVHSKMLEQQGGYYKATIPNVGTELYLAKHNGLLIFTNNRYLVQQNLQKGFDKKLRLGKEHCKMLHKNASVLYWDIPNTLEAVAGDDANSNIGPMATLNSFGKEFESMRMTTAKKPKSSVKSQYSFNFSQKDTNSLRQFFNLINEFYLKEIGGARI